MLGLGRSKVVFNLCKVSAAPRTFHSSPSTTTVSLPRRTLSTVADSEDFFNYTSGRWVYNEALRRDERRLVFDVEGLRRLAAESIGQSPADVVSLSKLGEGGFNRSFIIRLRGGLQMVARIPYPMTVSKSLVVASEVATIEYLRSSGISAPEIYGYSPDSDNASGTPYIFMEFVEGSMLSEVWPSLNDQEVISVVRQLTQLESRMMSLSFPAGGSLYLTDDLEKIAAGLGILLDNNRFCVGPDTSLPLWYGRRERLDVNRGPYKTVEAVLIAGTHKELAYLQHFGQPILPLRRERRPSYKFQQQLPSYHVENLRRYLAIASSLVPRNPSLSRFCIRHPDLQHNNIIVSRSPDFGCKVVGLIDWQHASILPMFLLGGVPQSFQNYRDSISQAMTPPALPEDFDELDEAEQARAAYLFRRRLVHYHYVSSTEASSPLHHAAFTDPLYSLRGRLFQQASSPWEGETLDLKTALIQATKKWEELTGGGVPCPISFGAEDLRETAALCKEVAEAERGFEFLQGMSDVGEEGWVQVEDYERAMVFFKGWKEKGLKGAESAEEREEIMGHWPWDDFDEENYM